MEQFILFRRRIGFGYGQPFKPQHKDIIDKDYLFRLIGKRSQQGFIHIQIHRWHEGHNPYSFRHHQGRHDPPDTCAHHKGHYPDNCDNTYQDNCDDTYQELGDGPCPQHGFFYKADKNHHVVNDPHHQAVNDQTWQLNPRGNDDEKHLVNEPYRHAVNDQKGNNNPPKRHLQPPKQCKPKHRFLYDLQFRFRQKQLDLQKLRKLQPQQFFQQLLPFQLLKQLFGQQPFQRKFGEPQQFLRRFQQGRLLKEISFHFPRQYEKDNHITFIYTSVRGCLRTGV